MFHLKVVTEITAPHYLKAPSEAILENATPYYFTLKAYACRSCLNFTISRGFRFENFTGTLAVGIPITLSWHRDVNETNQIDFFLVNMTYPFTFFPPTTQLFPSTDITQSYGTLNVTFPGSGGYLVEGRNQTSDIVADTRIFNVSRLENGGSDNSTIQSSFVPSSTVTPSASSVLESGEPSSSFTESVRSTATAPPMSDSTHRTGKTFIIIGTVIGSLLLFGGGIFLFIRKRRHRNRNLKHRLSPNFKIIPEQNSHSPPVGNKTRETISPMLVGEMTPNEGDRSQDTVEQNPEGDPVEDEGERRNSISTPVHVDTSEPQSPREESPQAPLDDVGAEVLRLRDQEVEFDPSKSSNIRVIRSLVTLLLIFGGGTLLFIHKQRHRNRNLKHRLSSNPEDNTWAKFAFSAGWKWRESEPVVGNPTEDEREGRNSIGTPWMSTLLTARVHVKRSTSYLGRCGN
ncbi:hypothetical protein EV421DRAFT_1743593 [Armillaria borealis]|uniref:Uncharacterized protein n=1 Tax=Armillaria borealis TaxID=47425 RepID=A0AA39MEV3_9AGAR|nr:hypothetical protein EV421DRAFT_1743593 [Armillaria borealis]